MSEYHRLTDQKYSDTGYIFQAIEMAKSDEEFNVELCTTPPPRTELELSLVDNEFESNIYSWKLVKRRRPRRRYTVSHGSSSTIAGGVCVNSHNGLGFYANCNGNGGLPPAPPSTPTSLTPTNTIVSSSIPDSGIVGVLSVEEQQRLDGLLYILDYTPKYKKKFKEQQRTDVELSELFNVVSITTTDSTSCSSSSKTKPQPERGVSTASRSIRKLDGKTFKVFKHNENLKQCINKHKECFRERDGEDSVSAPEYDTEEEDTRFHRLGRIKPSQRLSLTKRERRFARFEHAERMEAMVDIFDEAMNFTET